MLRIDFRHCSPPTDKMAEYAKAIHGRVWDHIAPAEFETILDSYDKCHDYIDCWSSEFKRLIRRHQDFRPIYFAGYLIDFFESDLV